MNEFNKLSKPIYNAAVQVGLIDGNFVVNPNAEQREKSLMHLTVSGTKDAILMVEAGAKEVSLEVALPMFIYGFKTGTNYEDIMIRNDRLLDGYLEKLDSFGKQSKKQLTGQMNTLTSTANVVAGQIRLAESSIDKQNKKDTLRRGGQILWITRGGYAAVREPCP